MAKAGFISGKLSSTNTIEGPLRDKAGQVFNVKSYGALGDGVISAGAVSGTDDTTAIQAAIDAAAAVHGTVYFPPGIYIHNSPLSLEAKIGVTLQGASGAMPWVFNPVSKRMASCLVFKGTGTTPGWNCDSAIGLNLRDLDFSYDSASFTGAFFRFFKSGTDPASTITVERCRFMSFTDTLKSAKCLISLRFAISVTFDRCAFYGADWLIRGFETNNGTGEAPNSISIIRCLAQGAVSGFIANIGDWWTIEDNTFEAFPITGVGAPACIIGGDTTGTQAQFCYRNNQHWDNTNHDSCIPIKQPSGQTWLATFDDNFFDVSFTNPGLHFQFNGLGTISINNNTFQLVCDGTTIPSLIDLGDSATALKKAVRITNNRWTSASNACPAIVTRITGHEDVVIENNSPSAFGRSITTIAGHERLGYIGSLWQPAITAAAGQSLGTLAVYGTDVAGYVQITAGGANSIAGPLVNITFNLAYIPHPVTSIDNNHHIPAVLLTPMENDSGGGAASVDAGAWVKTYFGDRTKFTICTKNAVPAGTVVQYSYRVVQV